MQHKLIPVEVSRNTRGEDRYTIKEIRSIVSFLPQGEVVGVDLPNKLSHNRAASQAIFQYLR